MANPVPAGSDVSAGTYKCTDCGYELASTVFHVRPLPSKLSVVADQQPPDGAGTNLLNRSPSPQAAQLAAGELDQAAGFVGIPRHEV